MKEIRGTYKDRIYGKDVYVLEDSIMESMKDFVKDRRYVREVLDAKVLKDSLEGKDVIEVKDYRDSIVSKGSVGSAN